MTQHTTPDGRAWYPTWAQAISDFSADGDEPGFDDVTVRMTLPAGIGGTALRFELSNRFGAAPVTIGHAAVTTSDGTSDCEFGGRRSVAIPAGESVWCDPVDLPVGHGDDVVVDLYLPEPTPYISAGGFQFDRSQPGDFAGARLFPLEGSAPLPEEGPREFPAPNSVAPTPDGTGWSLPAGGPLLRTIEVACRRPSAVVVALGGSSTAMGWPQYAAAAAPEEARISVVNRGISGNRVRLGAPAAMSSWGRSGLDRFDEDVLGTSGATHVVIAYNSNDWGLPGRITDQAEMPTLTQLIDGYRQLIDRAGRAGLAVVLATVTPLAPEMAGDALREGLRVGLNDWIRASGNPCADFDAAIRRAGEPSLLDPRYAAPDSTHPNVDGEKRLAREMLSTLLR